MNKKKILLLSPFFFPEPISTGKFNTDLAISLSRYGHEVVVLCYHQFYPDWKISESNHKLENIKIIRGGRFLKFSKYNFLRRLILEISFVFFVYRKISNLKNIDIVIPVFPPSLAFFFILPFINKKTEKIGLVHDLQEIYSLEKRGFGNKTISTLIHFVEKKGLNNCNKLIFLSNEMKNEAFKLYGLESVNAQVQFPFCNLELVDTNDLNHLFDSTKFSIVYSGALGDKQNPTKLYDFFSYASSELQNAVFYIFSKGNDFEKLKAKNKNQNIRFYNLVSKENLYELYKKSDVQILPQKENTSRGSLPSKLPNLLYSGCKILAITDKGSEIEKLFSTYNLGKINTEWDNKLLTKSLMSLLKEQINSNHQRNIANQLFSIDKMILKILN